VLLLGVACQRQVTVSSPSPSTSTAPAVGTVGGATPAEAVGMMLAAAKAEDIQAIGSVWGDTEGLAREKWPRSEFEMRAFYIVKCLRNDRYHIVNEGAAANNRRVATVQVTKGPINVQTTFQLVQGKTNRWYVEKVDLDPMTKICQMA
jgi:hypothetical protein